MDGNRSDRRKSKFVYKKSKRTNNQKRWKDENLRRQRNKIKKVMKLIVYTDGWSRGNPWNSGIGVYITDSDWQEIEKRYKNLGIKTNNEAEYLGALYGIRRAIELGGKEIVLYMDSRLVIKQLSGEWKIKKHELKKIHWDIIALVTEFPGKVSYNWVRREDNTEADRLANIAMDE